MAELKKNEQFFEHHLDGRGRIDARENCHLRELAERANSLTMAEVDKRRRKELIKDMLSKFGNVTVGIHGQELPKFAATDESKKWWKLANGKSTPPVQSQIRLQQNNKYWAKDDEIRLADASAEGAPVDQFKREHVPQPPKNTIAVKINHVLHCKPEDLVGNA